MANRQIEAKQNPLLKRFSNGFCYSMTTIILAYLVTTSLPLLPPFC